MKWNTVIVTGGSGFVGTHLVEALVKKAKRVVVLDVKKPTAGMRAADAVYKKVDILEKDLDALFKKESPDIVFHLAAHIDERESVREPVMNARRNIIGSLRVFEAARKFLKGTLVFASTAAVYGEQEALPVAETAEPNPVIPYGVSKLACERYLHFYKHIHGLRSVTLRLSNIYGPGQDESAECGAIAIFTARLLKGEQVYINNNGLTTRDYVYISDVVNAFLQAAESNETGVFNIGTGIEMSTIDLFNAIRDVTGVQVSPEFRERIDDMIKHSALDASRAKKVLGWRPDVMLEEGVEKTVEWYRDNV